MQLAIISILLPWETLCSVILIICMRSSNRARSETRFCLFLCWQRMVGTEPQAQAQAGQDTAAVPQGSPWQQELLGDKGPSPEVAVKEQEPIGGHSQPAKCSSELQSVALMSFLGSSRGSSHPGCCL